MIFLNPNSASLRKQGVQRAVALLRTEGGHCEAEIRELGRAPVCIVPPVQGRHVLSVDAPVRSCAPSASASTSTCAPTMPPKRRSPPPLHGGPAPHRAREDQQRTGSRSPLTRWTTSAPLRATRICGDSDCEHLLELLD